MVRPVDNGRKPLIRQRSANFACIVSGYLRVFDFEVE